MSTIVNNPSSAPVERTVVERSDNGGWAVAVIVLLAVLVVGGFVWMRFYQAPAAAPAHSNGGANINVTLPPQDNTPPPASTPTPNPTTP